MVRKTSPTHTVCAAAQTVSPRACNVSITWSACGKILQFARSRIRCSHTAMTKLPLLSPSSMNIGAPAQQADLSCTVSVREVLEMAYYGVKADEDDNLKSIHPIVTRCSDESLLIHHLDPKHQANVDWLLITDITKAQPILTTVGFMYIDSEDIIKMEKIHICIFKHDNDTLTSVNSCAVITLYITTSDLIVEHLAFQNKRIPFRIDKDDLKNWLKSMLNTCTGFEAVKYIKFSAGEDIEASEESGEEHGCGSDNDSD